MRYVQIVLLTLLLTGCGIPSTDFNDAKITQPELYTTGNSDCYTNRYNDYKPIWDSLNKGAKSALALQIIKECYP